MPKNSARDSRALTVGEIAKLGGVQPSAVSNWRKRHADFPLPVRSSAGADVFDYDDALAWLATHGRLNRSQEDDTEQNLWYITERIRDFVAIGDAALVTLQAIHLRQIADAPSRYAKDVAHFWHGLGTHLSLRDAWAQAVQTISGSHPQLASVLGLPRNVQNETLENLLATVDRAHNRNASWGKIATALLRRYMKFGGAQHFPSATPESVTELVASLLGSDGIDTYDAACGEAMVLAAAWRRGGREGHLVGQELHARSWQVGYLHLSILGASFELHNADTLFADRVRGRTFGRVVIEPPVNVRIDPRTLFGDDRWIYGIPRGTADWLWPQHAVAHLTEAGLAVVTLSLGALGRSQQDSQIRRAMLEADQVDAVIELPPGLWPGTSIPMALVIFAKRRPNRTGRVLFIDGRRLGSTRRGRLRELSASEVKQITKAVERWSRGEIVSIAQFAATAKVQDVLARDSDLSPSLYVEYGVDGVRDIDGELILPRLQRLTRSLSDVLKPTSADAGAAGSADAITLLVREAQALESIQQDEWPKVELATILMTSACTGTRQDREGSGPEIPWIPARALGGGTTRLRSRPLEVTRGDTRSRLAIRGDLLLVARGLGKVAPGHLGCAVVDFDGETAFAESLLRVRCNPNFIEPDFLRLYLTSRQGQEMLTALSTGTVIGNMRVSAFMKARVPLPPLSAQRIMVEVARRMESAVEKLSMMLAESQELLEVAREVIASGLNRPEMSDSPVRN